MSLHAQRAQRPVEALARPVAPGDRLVDARGQQELGRDLPAALGDRDLAALDGRPADLAPVLGAVREYRVGEAVGAFEVVDHSVTAPAVVAIAHDAAIIADARGDDMHVMVGVRHHHVACIGEAHPAQIIATDLCPLVVGQPLVLGQAQRAVVDGALQAGAQRPCLAELAGQGARPLAHHVAVHDARRIVAKLLALPEDVLQHAAKPPPDLCLLDHAGRLSVLVPEPAERHAHLFQQVAQGAVVALQLGRAQDAEAVRRVGVPRDLVDVDPDTTHLR